jgi:hypothetical protein
MSQTWDELKKEGSGHYKSGDVQPIDMFKAGNALRDFAVCSVVKYVWRNRREVSPSINVNDLHKARHFIDMLLSIAIEEA